MFTALYIFLALVLNFLVILTAVYIIEKKINDVEKINDSRFAYIDNLAEENETKISGLYKEDEHGTLRPKVDILSDTVGDIWENLEEIYKELNKPDYK